MSRTFALFAFLIFLLTSSFTYASPEEEIRDFLKRYYAAWNTLVSENASPFYAKDADLVFFDAAPFQYKTWQEYKEGSQKYFFDILKSGKLVPYDDLKIKQYGNVAFITLTFHLSGMMKDGSSMEIDMRQTSVLEKRDGKWIIVHEHISAPLPTPATP